MSHQAPLSDGLQGFVAAGFQAFDAFNLHPASVWRYTKHPSGVWGYDTGRQVQGVEASGEFVYVCGQRSTSWTGGDGATQASVWCLNKSDASVVWTYDSGDTARGVTTDGTFVWVCGIRNDIWDGSTGPGDIAATWKLNASDGAVVWDWDPGPSDGGILFGIDDDGVNAYVSGRGLLAVPKVSIWKLDANGGLLLSAAPNVSTIGIVQSGGEIWTTTEGTNARGHYNAAFIQQWFIQLANFDPAGIDTDGANTWVAGEYDPVDPAQHKNLFKYNGAGALLWDWDSGIDLGDKKNFAVKRDDADIWVGGEISEGWDGADPGDGPANFWSVLDADQSVSGFENTGSTQLRTIDVDTDSVYVGGTRQVSAP